MCTLRAQVHTESVQETSSVCVGPPCASRLRVKLKAGNKQITEALHEQIVKAVHFPYLKSFPILEKHCSSDLCYFFLLP